MMRYLTIALALLAGCVAETVDPSPPVAAGDLDASAATPTDAQPPPTPRDASAAPHP